MKRKCMIIVFACVVMLVGATIVASAGSDFADGFLGACYVTASASVSSDGSTAYAQTTMSLGDTGDIWKASGTVYWLNEQTSETGTNANGAEGGGPGGGGPSFSATWPKTYYKITTAHRVTYHGATYTNSFTVYR
ncbi:MAG: hypothetical protein J5531_04480 [Lachnospiraceae bacterium]|nr:hypothetical protein [Lachnospiraceae bacterium]